MYCRRKGDTSLLLIEDSEPELELMAYLLRAGNYCVMTAKNGEAGLALAEQIRVDLVLCDVFLPGLDGYGVARRLKANPNYRRVPLLAVTSVNQVNNPGQLLAAGFDGYISKPIEARTFVSQLSSFLALAKHGSGLSGPEVSRPGAANCRILLVDDSPPDGERLRAGLAARGYQVALADGAAPAMEMLAAGPFDLIVSDLHRPEHDGLSFVSSLKADPRQRGLPVLFLSSSVWREQDRPMVLGLPRTRCLRRPLYGERLLDEVEATLKAGMEAA